MSEHLHGQAVLDEIVPLGRALRQAIPDVYKGYAALPPRRVRAWHP